MKVSNRFGMMGKGTIMFLTFLLAVCFIAVYSARSDSQTVETDQANYSAGDMAEIFGSGWEPGESVAAAPGYHLRSLLLPVD